MWICTFKLNLPNHKKWVGNKTTKIYTYTLYMHIWCIYTHIMLYIYTVFIYIHLHVTHRLSTYLSLVLVTKACPKSRFGKGHFLFWLLILLILPKCSNVCSLITRWKEHNLESFRKVERVSTFSPVASRSWGKIEDVSWQQCSAHKSRPAVGSQDVEWGCREEVIG